MKPFPFRNLTILQRIFNVRLSRARQTVECSFGITTKKIRILSRPINCSVETTKCITQACVVLRNWLNNKYQSYISAEDNEIHYNLEGSAFSPLGTLLKENIV